MNEFRYDTYCGMYCGACDIINAYKDGNEEDLLKIYNNKISQISPAMKVSKDQVKCYGCKTDTVFINCSYCQMRKCAIEKEVESCIECNDFPCSNYEISKEKEVITGILPQIKAIPKNLKEIKRDGVEKWLENQKQKWECPQCQTSFTWQRETCSNCGRELESLKDFNNLSEDDFNL